MAYSYCFNCDLLVDSADVIPVIDWKGQIVIAVSNLASIQQ